jgi:hypothetical protein
VLTVENVEWLRDTAGKRRLDELVEEAIIDAYGESEQSVGLLNSRCPLRRRWSGPLSGSSAWTSMTRTRSLRSVDVDSSDRRFLFSISRCPRTAAGLGVDRSLSTLGTRRTVVFLAPSSIKTGAINRTMSVERLHTAKVT